MTDTKKEKQSIKGFSIYLSIFFFIISIFSILLLNFYINVTTPISLKEHFVTIEILPGVNTKTVANLLKKEGLIRKSRDFVYLTILKRKANKIQAGEYRLSPDMTSLQILDILTNGKVILYSVTIPEGLNLFEIANLLAKKKMGDKKTFISLSYENNLIEYLAIKTNSLEGYLFPDTYYFSKDASEIEIYKKMIDNFKKIVTSDLKKRAKEIGFSIHEVITLASLIEKETGKTDERKLISAVFHNRLKKKMRLQCDPTVIYALWDRFDGNLRKNDLKFNSPYNTYKNFGLPPGPIANPGKDSIDAVLSPVDVDFLYFVSKRDGSHFFSKDFRSHNLAVRKYQLRHK